MTLDVSTKLLLKCFRALFASSSSLKPTNPNLRNLPSLVNFREQSVTVPKAENMDLNLSSFICTHIHTQLTLSGGLKQNAPITPRRVTYPVREIFNDDSRHSFTSGNCTNMVGAWFLNRCQQTSVDSSLGRHVDWEELRLLLLFNWIGGWQPAWAALLPPTGLECGTEDWQQQKIALDSLY